MLEPDLTPKQAITKFIGGEHVDVYVLRSAVAQLLYAYDELVDLAYDATDGTLKSRILNTLASELVQQQESLEETYVLTESVDALATLIRTRKNKNHQEAL